VLQKMVDVIRKVLGKKRIRVEHAPKGLIIDGLKLKVTPKALFKYRVVFIFEVEKVLKRGYIK
jgi:hypothetical protein